MMALRGGDRSETRGESVDPIPVPSLAEPETVQAIQRMGIFQEKINNDDISRPSFEGRDDVGYDFAKHFSLEWIEKIQYEIITWQFKFAGVTV